MYNLNQIHLGIYKRIMSFKWKFRLSHFGNNSLIHKPLQIIGGGGVFQSVRMSLYSTGAGLRPNP